MWDRDYEEMHAAVTESEIHREWHRLNGPPESTVCPWDCYDPPEPPHCPDCDEYLDDDGAPCRNADDPAHIERMNERLSEQLAYANEQLVAQAARELEPDPWF